MSMHTVAVMGLGVRGKIHLHGLLENPDYYKVVGLCDIDEPKMKAVAEEYHLDDVPLFTDAEEMLKETRPEIFVFVTYPDLQPGSFPSIRRPFVAFVHAPQNPSVSAYT